MMDNAVKDAGYNRSAITPMVMGPMKKC